MTKTILFACWVLLLTFVMAFVEGTAPLRWPAGRYGLPNTIHGCPNTDGFTWDTGNITQALGPNSKTSTSFHLKATVTNKGIQRSFCIKNTDPLNPARPAWPAGRYCIYRKGGACPAGLKEGSLLWNNRFDLFYTKSTGVVPDGLSTSSNTLINFCCAVNGDKTAPIPLPLESPFVLLAFQSATCQAVRGTLHKAEYIYYNTDGSNKLTSPHPYGADLFSMNITYCYYQACRNNLTALNGTIMSPFYPSNYPSDADCRWGIKVPASYAITLDFEDIDIEASDSLCSKDWLQVSIGNPQTVYSKYCGKRVNLELEIRDNVVVLGFHSDGVASLNKGFRVHYRATKITVPMTTTHKTTVTKTTSSTTTSKTMSPTTAPNPSTSTQTANPATEQSTTSTKQGSEGQGTTILTEISRPSPSTTPDIRGSRKKDSERRSWVIPVVACLSVLLVTVLLVVLYFKCLKKRNTIRRRHSNTVNYNKKCSYVDMEIPRDAVFGIRSNPNADAPILYDNYPGDNGYSEPKPIVAIQGPVYEEIPDPICNQKGQKNNIYESMATMNDYDTLQRTSGTAHVSSFTPTKD